jgi:hypothetical protein
MFLKSDSRNPTPNIFAMNLDCCLRQILIGPVFIPYYDTPFSSLEVPNVRANPRKGCNSMNQHTRGENQLIPSPEMEPRDPNYNLIVAGLQFRWREFDVLGMAPPCIM